MFLKKVALNSIGYEIRMHGLDNQKIAHSVVRSAVKLGILKKERCSKCGSEKTPVAHHWSYLIDHWLDVVWLCSSCHSKLHIHESDGDLQIRNQSRHIKYDPNDYPDLIKSIINNSNGKEYIDSKLVEKISKFDFSSVGIKSSHLNFKNVLSKIGAMHLIPCRVCLKFQRVQITPVNENKTYEAAALCSGHLLKFKNYYRTALNLEDEIIIKNLPKFPFASEVIEALVMDDGSIEQDYIDKIYDTEIPYLINLMNCNLFIRWEDRSRAIYNVRKRKAKDKLLNDIEMLAQESVSAYGIESFPFRAPWDDIEWWSKRHGPNCPLAKRNKEKTLILVSGSTAKPL